METANIHGTCVLCADAGKPFGAPADAGMLLVGESGSGKSDLALRLMAMGGRLVADDRCEIFFDGALRARAPGNIAGLMEIRGLGIAALPCAPAARIALVACAGRAHAVARFPEFRCYTPPSILAVPHGARPPEIDVDAHAPSAPAKLLVAVAAFENHLFRETIQG